MTSLPQKNFVVYKSSAGSGKTYTLVREYIRLVINNPERYSNILAITFTNKAANEMKSRILANLRELSEFDGTGAGSNIASMAGDLSNALNLDYSQIATRANVALTLILHNYSNFAVSTIDSFVHRLVRIFANDLGLPIGFDVEMDEDKLISKSIDLLISKVGADPDLTAALVRFIESKMDDEKSWNIENQLKDFTKNILKENSYEALKKLRGLSVSDFIAISRKLSEISRKFESQLYLAAKEAVDLIHRNGIEPNLFFQGNSGIYGYLNRFANKNFEYLQPKSHARKTIDEGQWYAKKAPSAVAAAIDQIKPQLAEMVNEIMEIVNKSGSDYVLSKLVQQNIYMVAVLSEIEKVMDEFRQNENIVHISEFNKRIAAIVQKEAIPFIYERIGEKYRHYLLDEFQDTSLLQWQNLVPLLENSLSANHFNMIVGDGKQAIYRWRSGEVEQFAALPKIFNRNDDPLSIARENLFISQYQGNNLETNYRSRVEIIEFNNQFFSFAKKHLSEGFQHIYDDVIQKSNPSKAGGYIQIEFLKNDDNDKDAFNQQMLDRVLGIVQMNMQHYGPDDIAILTRNNISGSMIARHLLQNGISVVSSEVLLLSASQEVNYLITMLKVLLAPEDKIAIAEALIFLFQQKKLKAGSLHELFSACKEINPGNENGRSLGKILAEHGFDFQKQLFQSLSLPEFFEYLINIFNLDSKGSNPFLQFFMDLVYEFSSASNESAQEFLTYWDETGWKKSIIIPEATPSVRIMTIHKAKGLQFPVVIYPFAIETSRISIKETWIETNFDSIPELKTSLIEMKKEISETTHAGLLHHETDKSFLDTLNLLYVAMTRPKDRLYIISKDKTNDEGKWNKAKNFPDVADLLHEFLQEKEIQPDEAGRYGIGESRPFEKRAGSESQPAIHAESGYNAGEWRRKILLRRQSPRVWESDKQDSLREKGLLVHFVMSQLKTRNDLEHVLAKMVGEGVIAENQKPKLQSIIQNVMARSAISSYFNDGNLVFNEKEILMQDGTIFRPDRVVFCKDKVVVMDYKTGKEDPSHHRQLQTYADALSEMGYKNIVMEVVYL